MPSFKMKFSGVTILQGVKFSIIPIDFEWALQQCSAIALPVIVLPFVADVSTANCAVCQQFTKRTLYYYIF